MSIVDKLVLTQPEYSPARVQKKHFSRFLSPAEEEIIRQHLNIKRLSHRDFIKLPQDVKEVLDVQFSKRRTLVDYITTGIKTSGVTSRRPKALVGKSSSLKRVKIPTYVDPKDESGNPLGKYIRYIDTKLALEYGSIDDPIRTFADTVLHHKGNKYFGLYWRGLQRPGVNSYLDIVNKVGSDIYGRKYGGFVIFFPTDDESINLVQELTPSRRILESIAEEHKTERKFRNHVRAFQRQTADRYRKDKRRHLAQLIYNSFGELAHFVGLPYDISTEQDYFFDMTPTGSMEPNFRKNGTKPKHKKEVLDEIGYEGTDVPSVRY